MKAWRYLAAWGNWVRCQLPRGPIRATLFIEPMEEWCLVRSQPAVSSSLRMGDFSALCLHLGCHTNRRMMGATVLVSEHRLVYHGSYQRERNDLEGMEISQYPKRAQSTVPCCKKKIYPPFTGGACALVGSCTASRFAG